MRSLCAVAARLNSGSRKLLVQPRLNYGLPGCSTLPADSPKTKTKKQSRGLSEEVTKILKEIRAYKSKKNKSAKTLYLIDKEVAKQFSALIMSNRQRNGAYVAEINSGLGFLSAELLQAGVRSLNMFESVPYLIPNLTALVDKYPDRAMLRCVDFQAIWSIGYTDWKESTNGLSLYFEGVEKTAWEKEPVIEIIGSIGDSNFIRRLMSTVIFRTTLAQFGRMVAYVAVPPSVWLILTCNNEHYDIYRTHSVLFQVLFDGKILGTLPRSGFYPHYRKSKEKRRCRVRRDEIMTNDPRVMNVIKIEPKADLFTQDFTESDVVPFYYFLHHHLKSRRNRVIPALEKWVPGCGRTLIAQGFTIYTEFGELTPEGLLELFKLFRSWPEFKKSSFESCMDTFLARVEEHIVLDSNSDNLEEMFTFSLDETQSPLE